ncbi:hypothetical protein L1887_57649 [Cichorium endivia]|nr:hypothetical protein L1887_57649 [Cichorium endivia]
MSPPWPGRYSAALQCARCVVRFYLEAAAGLPFGLSFGYFNGALPGTKKNKTGYRERWWGRARGGAEGGREAPPPTAAPPRARPHHRSLYPLLFFPVPGSAPLKYPIVLHFLHHFAVSEGSIGAKEGSVQDDIKHSDDPEEVHVTMKPGPGAPYFNEARGGRSTKTEGGKAPALLPACPPLLFGCSPTLPSRKEGDGAGPFPRSFTGMLYWPTRTKFSDRTRGKFSDPSLGADRPCSQFKNFVDVSQSVQGREGFRKDHGKKEFAPTTNDFIRFASSDLKARYVTRNRTLRKKSTPKRLFPPIFGFGISEVRREEKTKPETDCQAEVNKQGGMLKAVWEDHHVVREMHFGNLCSAWFFFSFSLAFESTDIEYKAFRVQTLTKAFRGAAARAGPARRAAGPGAARRGEGGSGCRRPAGGRAARTGGGRGRSGGLRRGC